MYVVYDNFKQFSKNKFQFGKLTKTPTQEVYNLYVSDKESKMNKKIYFTSQKLQIVWDKMYSNDELTFTFELGNYENKFIESFRSLLVFILKNFRKRFLNNKTDDDIQLDCFKTYTNNSTTMRIYNTRISDIMIYDEKHEMITSTALKRNDIINVLLEMRSCIVKDDKLSFDFNVVQIMRLNPNNALNQRCLIDSLYARRMQRSSIRSVPPPPPPPPSSVLSSSSSSSKVNKRIINAVPSLNFSIEELKTAKDNLKSRVVIGNNKMNSDTKINN